MQRPRGEAGQRRVCEREGKKPGRLKQQGQGGRSRGEAGRQRSQIKGPVGILRKHFIWESAKGCGGGGM